MFISISILLFFWYIILKLHWVEEHIKVNHGNSIIVPEILICFGFLTRIWIQIAINPEVTIVNILYILLIALIIIVLIKCNPQHDFEKFVEELLKKKRN